MKEYTLCERKYFSSGRESYVSVRGFERMSMTSMVDAINTDDPCRNFDFYVREATSNNITVTYTQWRDWMGKAYKELGCA